jgi:predicted transcriptional regulator
VLVLDGLSRKALEVMYANGWMRVNEIAPLLGISESRAYPVLRLLYMKTDLVRRKTITTPTATFYMYNLTTLAETQLEENDVNQ